jgi:recombination protein RecA
MALERPIEKVERGEKNKAIEAAIANLEKQFGKGTVMRLGERRVEELPVISTNSIGIDAALGVGGFPRGRIIEVYGPESSGKTTLALHVVAEAQKAGGIAAYVDAEHALDAKYAERLGVNIDDMLVSQPDSGEQALEVAESLVRSGAIDVLVIDSVAALTPRAELEGDMGDSLPGLQARLMSQALRKLTAVVGRSNTCLIFINQIREKIGVMFGCFQYDTRVLLANGKSEKIGKIVNQRMPVEVLSFNAQTGKVEPRRVVNWFDNGKADYFLQFDVEGGPSGFRHFAATPNHTILTPNGEVAAGDLRVGDQVLALVNDYHLTDDQVQLLLGGMLGDGTLRLTGTHAASFSSTGRGMGADTFTFPTMTKLHPHIQKPDLRVRPATIKKIYVKPPTRSMQRFDIEVEGNHTYLVDGVVVHNSPETTTGGRALKFYSTIRVDIRRIGAIKDGENVVGNRTKVKIAKNKVAPPFRECEFDIMYGEGISKFGEIIDLGVENKIVEKSGAWFSYKGERLGQGRENAKNSLRENPELCARVESEVRAALGIAGSKPQAVAAEAGEVKGK